MTEPKDTRADLLIRGARLIDGLGGASSAADVAVRGDRIVAIGELSGWRAAAEIDAGGKALAPGFIDVHTHDDRMLLADPLAACKVSQGVTTVITGNCGISLAPLVIDHRPPAPLDLIIETVDQFYPTFAAYLDALDAAPAALNAACLVGHTTLRVGAMSDLERPANADEIVRMRGALEAALEAGAIGLSTGLYYPPANAADTDEVIALAKAVHAAGGIHTTHMRDESDGVLESLEETFTIGREGRVPVVISHHKCAGHINHGRSGDTLAAIDAARKTQPVGLDVYPYVAGSTMLHELPWSRASRTVVAWSGARPDAAGRDLDELAAEMQCTPLEAIERLQPATGIYFMMDEGDVRRILADPHSMIGSDGLPHDVHPHPRLWGTFPRVLGHYARELGLFSLEEAVRKMTSLPARQFGLTDRGVVREGAYADLVLFDPDTVLDRASFERPIQAADGIDTVIVNGRVVWQGGASTGARPGRALRRGQLELPRYDGRH